MTENWLLNWSVMAVSLFNTILLVWLGLTVLLNAERRTWGLWLSGSVILLGGIFFLIHSIILGLGLNPIGRSIDFWWRLGWIPVVTIPYIWYVVILWYSGFWDGNGDKLKRRHNPWLAGTTVLAAGILLLLIFANPLPSFVQAAQLNLTRYPLTGWCPAVDIDLPRVYIALYCPIRGCSAPSSTFRTYHGGPGPAQSAPLAGRRSNNPDPGQLIGGVGNVLGDQSNSPVII